MTAPAVGVTGPRESALGWAYGGRHEHRQAPRAADTPVGNGPRAGGRPGVLRPRVPPDVRRSSASRPARARSPAACSYRTGRPTSRAGARSWARSPARWWRPPSPSSIPRPWCPRSSSGGPRCDAPTICAARTDGAMAQLARILGPEPDGTGARHRAARHGRRTAAARGQAALRRAAGPRAAR